MDNELPMQNSLNPAIPQNPSGSNSYIIWVIIIIILAILGFLIYYYYPLISQQFLPFINNLFTPIDITTGSNVAENINQTVKTEGVQKEEISKEEISKEETTQNIQGAQATSSITNSQDVTSTVPVQNQQQHDALNTALNQAEKQQQPQPSDNSQYSADISTSSIQNSKSSSKTGWCFIGEDRGFRSCIQVNEHDKCMSGDIFPNQDICINPNLRQ